MILGSGLGLVLSLVFGCLVLALIAELYYLLWWKKQLSHLLCWPRPTEPSPAGDPAPLSDVEAGPTKDLSVEAELLKLQNRLLFTIKEETREDLESDDGSRKCSRSRSLSDLILAVDSISNPLDCHYSNPLYESTPAPSSSPPPKFKFLRDAEEKLQRRLLLEQPHKIQDDEEREWRNGSFIRIIVGNSNSNSTHFTFHSSSNSQVTPLPSSPPPISPHNKPAL